MHAWWLFLEYVHINVVSNFELSRKAFEPASPWIVVLCFNNSKQIDDATHSGLWDHNFCNSAYHSVGKQMNEFVDASSFCVFSNDLTLYHPKSHRFKFFLNIIFFRVKWVKKIDWKCFETKIFFHLVSRWEIGKTVCRRSSLYESNLNTVSRRSWLFKCWKKHKQSVFIGIDEKWFLFIEKQKQQN